MPCLVTSVGRLSPIDASAIRRLIVSQTAAIANTIVNSAPCAFSVVE